MAHLACSHDGCSKAPSFGFPGKERSACSAHKRPGMQYLKQTSGASASQMHIPRGLEYAPSVQRDPDFTRAHGAASSASSSKHSLCRYAGCTKAPSFGFPDGERVSCSAHKRPGMEYLAGSAEHHRGKAGDALTNAMGHVPKGLDYHHTTDTRQQHHARGSSASSSPGTNNITGDISHCRVGGCTKAPSYGWETVPGEKTGVPILCAQHKSPAMVYLRHISDPGARASSNEKVAASKNHVPRGLEYIPSVVMESDRIVHSDHPHCAHRGCTKAPSYGIDGQRGSHCFSHKRMGMIFLKHDAKPSVRVEAPISLPPTLPAKVVGNCHQADTDTGAGEAPSGVAGLTGDATAAATATAAAAAAPADPPSVAVQHQHEKEGNIVEADLAEARECAALSRQRMEDSSVGVKYLSNILKHPDDAKYRTLKTSNRKFYTEVWLNGGVRGVFLALGFRQRDGGTVSLDPLAPNTIECIEAILQDLSAGTGGAVNSSSSSTTPAAHAADAAWNSHRSPMG